MNKGMKKSTFREIKGSFGRYLAILLIVALGVGFFSGLKVAYDAMVYTADQYWRELRLFDYKLLSTIGFDEDAEEYLRNNEEVAAVEGSKSADILMKAEDGTEMALKTMSITKEINKVVLLEGRMPQEKQECLADSHAFSKEDIGKKLKVSDSNEEEDADKFEVREYTIVGIVCSPLYTLFERGTTSVGNGNLSGFLYLEDDAYSMDYDTEIYVFFNQDSFIYSDEYEQDMKKFKEPVWENLCETAAKSRYDRIYGEAMEEIADAQNTLKDKKAEGEQELSEAYAEIADGKNKLADGESAIRTAKNSLSESKKTFEEKEKEYQNGLKEYKKNKKKYDKGKSAYDEGLKTYKEQYEEYEKGLKDYNDGKEAYDASEREYNSAKEQFEAGKAYLSEEECTKTEQKLAAWKNILDETAGKLKAAKAQLDVAGPELQKAKEKLDVTKTQLDTAGKQLKKAKKQLDLAGKQIKEAKKQFADAKSQIAEKEGEIYSARQELSDGEKEYEDAKAEFDQKIKDAEDEITEGKEELADLEEPEVYVLGRETNIGYASFENDAAIVKGVARVFPIFFFLVAVLVCMTTMARMMEEQRTQIGVLKALGYSNGSIIGKYITYSGSAALIGAVGGFFAGTWLFSIVIWTAYKMMYNLGDLIYVFKVDVLIVCIVVALLCSVGTTVVTGYQDLQEMAACLMRPKPPKAGKRVLLEKIPFIWNRLKFLDKVSLRNLFRYKKRFFMMIIGVSGCTALLVAGLGIKDSIASIADTQYETISLYDMVVSVDEEVPRVKGMKEFVKTSCKSVDLHIKDKSKSQNLLVVEESDTFEHFMSLHTEDGDVISFPEENEIVISFKIADDLNLGVGDKVRLQSSELTGGEVMISGIYTNYFDHYVIMCPETYVKLFGENPEYNQLFVNVEAKEEVHKVAARFMKEDGVSRVSISEDSQKQITDMMGSLNYVVILVIACAAMLAFIVIYNLNNINITERIREIATIKVLGFYKEETNSYVFRENFLLTLLGSLAGVVIGHYLHAFIMAQIKIDMIAFDVHVEPLSFILSVVFTLIFNQIVNLFMSGKLERIHMAESLKSVE